MIWVVIQVEEGGIMGVTQAMKHLHHEAMTDALHSSASSLGWSCSSPMSAKSADLMSTPAGSPAQFIPGLSAAAVAASAPGSLANPFHLNGSPPTDALWDKTRSV